MRTLARPLLLGVLVLAAACGGGSSAPARPTVDARQALTAMPEQLELGPVSTRQELLREVLRLSASEAGQPAAEGLVLFPISRNGEWVAAPSLAGREDLLQAPAAGSPVPLSFEARAGQRWSEDARESLQGLSEREAAELVARNLLSHWGLHPSGRVQVDRAENAPYAVAYVDGILRINPCFLYLVAAYGAASATAAIQ